MSNGDTQARMEAADIAARALGYHLGVTEALNMPQPITHMVFAFPDTGRIAMGRFLTYSTSEAEAAEAGLEIIRGIVQRGDPWPEAN